MKKNDLYDLYFNYPKAYEDYDNLQLNPEHLENAIDITYKKLVVYAEKFKA